MAGKGFGGLKPKTGNKDSLRLEELVDMHKFPDKKWVQLRFIDKVDPLVVRQHWIKILGGKDKREITIPRYCIAFDPLDPETPKEGVKCPYCDISTGKDGAMRTSEFFLMNAIVRDIQEEEPAKKAKHTSEETKTGFKDMRSKSWTPVRVVRLTATLVARIQELGETNLHKDKKSGDRRQYDASDAKYGFDVQIKYKADAAGTDKYSCDKVEGGATPLSAEEKEYLTYELGETLLDQSGRMSEKQAKEDFKRMDIVGDIPDDDDDDDEDDAPKKKKGKSRALDDDEDDEDDVPVKKGKKKKPFDDDEDDEDEAPKKSKKKKPALDDDDDDEDEAPKSKKAKAKKKPALDDDDEDEDEAPKKKAKKKPALDDDDEDDEDEAPKKKSSAKSKTSKKPVKKKAALDDDDEDEDDEEEAPRKKSSTKSKTSKKPVKKKSRLDDDDDE